MVQLGMVQVRLLLAVCVGARLANVVGVLAVGAPLPRGLAHVRWVHCWALGWRKLVGAADGCWLG